MVKDNVHFWVVVASINIMLLFAVSNIFFFVLISATATQLMTFYRIVSWITTINWTGLNLL